MVEVKKKVYQQAQFAYPKGTENSKELSIPDLGPNPQKAYTDAMQRIRKALDEGVPKEKIIQVYRPAIKKMGYEGAFVGIHKKTMIAGSSTETMNKTSDIMYELLGIPREKIVQPAAVQIPGNNWSEQLAQVYQQAAGVYMKNTGAVGADRVSAVNPQIRQVAIVMSQTVLPNLKVGRIEEIIKDHMLRDNAHHLREAKNLTTPDLAKGLMDEMKRGHFRTKKLGQNV